MRPVPSPRRRGVIVAATLLLLLPLAQLALAQVPDTDGDGITDDVDNCVSVANFGQADLDDDSLGDACDPDADGDVYDSIPDGGFDCDDMDPGVNPEAFETPYDEIDQDCDGADLTDVDEDLFSWTGAGGSDCDDMDEDINPDASDLPANGIDEDCDGVDAALPANDDFADAQALELSCEGSCWSSANIATSGATVEEGEPLDPCSVGATVWFHLDVPTPSDVSLFTASDFPLALTAFSGDGNLSALSTAGCATSTFPGEGPASATLSFFAGAGDWWIQVGGLASEGGAWQGTGTLDVSVVPAPWLAIEPAAPTIRVNEKLALSADVTGFFAWDVFWDFGDDGSGSGFDALHRWTATGSYNVSAVAVSFEELPLGIIDEGPFGPVGSTVVTVVAAPLTAAFTATPFEEEGETIVGSVDEDEAPVDGPVVARVGQPILFAEEAFGGNGDLSFEWDFGDGTEEGEEEIPQAVGATGPWAVHAFDAIGSYPVVLTVHAGTSEARGTRMVHVFDEVPLEGTVFPGGNTTVSFDPFITFRCEVDFTDGEEGPISFSGTIRVATDPLALEAGTGPLPPRTAGLVFVTFVDGPGPGDCDRVILTFPYDPEAIADARLTESRLDVLYWDGTAWSSTKAAAGDTIPGVEGAEDLHVFSSTVDGDADEATAVVDHTSSYALGGKTAVGGGGGGGGPAAGDAGAGTGTGAADGGSGAGTGSGAGSGSAGGAGGGGAGSGGGAGGSGGGGGVRAPAVDVVDPDGRPFGDFGLDATSVDGRVVFVGRDVDTSGVRYVLVGPDGSETVLGGNESASWDSSTASNGRYRVEMRDGDGQVLASQGFLVVNPSSTPEEVAGAVLVGAGVMVGGFLLTTAFGAVTEGAKAVSEDKFRERTKRMRLTAWTSHLSTVPSLAIGIPLFVLFFTLDGMEALDLQAYLARLPSVAAAAAIVFTCAYSMEILLNIASGARSRFQLLVTGAIALVASSLLFRNAFGYPGFVEEDEGPDGIPVHVAGWRSIALYGAILALTVPFFLVMLWGWYGLGEAGVAIALGLLATSSLPFKPVPGANVWQWNKPVSVLAIAGTFGLLVAYELAYVSPAQVAFGGVLALLAFVGLYVWIRRQPKGLAVPPPLDDIAAAFPVTGAEDVVSAAEAVPVMETVPAADAPAAPGRVAPRPKKAKRTASPKRRPQQAGPRTGRKTARKPARPRRARPT